MPTYLDSILAAHRQRASEDHRLLDRLVDEAAAARSRDPARPFIDSLRCGPGLSVIAEVKRRSPTRGDLAPSLDPASVAQDYEAGGAACLSVLTDENFFGGSPSDLWAARTTTRLPVLRKDFTVSEADVCDACLMGADAVLLIVAALTDHQLARFLSLAETIGLAALVEVHDETELDRALSVGATLVGVNQRDLRTFDVDKHKAELLGPRIPAGTVRVAESGLTRGDEVERLAAAGYDAVLVGESVVTASDRQAAVREIVNAGLHGRATEETVLGHRRG